MSESLNTVIRYHEETKHQLHRQSRSLGFMDWSNQPDPWRRFDGAERIRLPLPETEEGPTFEALHSLSSGSLPLTRESVSHLLYLSLAISAWKTAGGASWALRINPSSGNLHPTEGYLILPEVDGLGSEPGVYHYLSLEHALERRATIPGSTWTHLMEPFGPDSFLLGFSSVHWRESWKYGERAYRYCQHDAGHAIAAVRYAAAFFGWRYVVLSHTGDDDVASLFGLDREEDFKEVESEHPDLIGVVLTGDPGVSRSATDWPPEKVLNEVRSSSWKGTANLLSPQSVDWEIIDEVATAARKPRGSLPAAYERHTEPVLPSVAWSNGKAVSAFRVIRQRRSAVDFDGSTTLNDTAFFALLDGLLPRPGRPPFDALDWRPTVHLFIFVHRVTGLRPGIYSLVRRTESQKSLQENSLKEFEWTAVESAPEHLPFYLLAEGDTRRIGRTVSCHQDIAADGVFSLGMVAEFDGPLTEAGPWFYRRLFWETGVIGQAFYLGAEAAGIRATGIGCFFDDVMHETLGFSGRTYQSLYHLAAGGPVDDPRLSTLSAYDSAQPDRVPRVIKR